MWTFSFGKQMGMQKLKSILFGDIVRSLKKILDKISTF